MFTGIITDLGNLEARHTRPDDDLRLVVATTWESEQIALGASIACNGVCLTLVEKAPRQLTFDVSGETLSRTTIGAWREGQQINLERSLRLGDELGGHLVYGHVDGLAEVLDITREAGSLDRKSNTSELQSRGHLVCRLLL